MGASWVGGEYRCIHFRTGELGQGSRTALPVFGYFINKVLQDPLFRHYRGRFPEAKEEIPKMNYYGPAYYIEADSTEDDSIGETELENPIVTEEESEEPL